MTCPVCGDARFDLKVLATLDIQRCGECGLHTRVIREQTGTGYANNVDSAAYERSVGDVRRAQGEAIVAIVREHIRSGEWLDVGCGFGYLLEAAQSAGFSVRGVEPNPTAAQEARTRIAGVEHGFLTKDTRSADVLSTLDVLEHLEDMNAFARLAKQKARGLWVIKVPSSDGLYFRIAHTFRIPSAVKRLWQFNYEHPHRVYFNETTLTRFLDKHHFDVVATHYLDEVPHRTVVNRLTFDGAIPRWKAHLAAPLFLAINLIERLRSRSDALLVIARPR